MASSFEKVCVVGLGYIGLPTAAILATHGLSVTGIDKNPTVVETVNKGKIHIVEPELEAVVSGVVATGRLKAASAVEAAEVFLIAVPTPLGKNEAPDLSYVQSAVSDIAPLLVRGNLVILESTSPVGTTEQVSEGLAKGRPDLTFPHQAGELADIQIAYCPERVLPGQVLHELVNNDRVIGGMTPRCAERTVGLYTTFVRGNCLVTDSRTAEMTKLTENAFRDVNIAFANELSMICDQLRINVWELIDLANRHPRVKILQPGPGVGGHCIAVDPWFIIDSAPEQAKLMRTAREVNDLKPRYVVRHVRERSARFSNPVIACLGLSFKADIDDLRESPAVEIVRDLAESVTGELLVVEPHIRKLPAVLAGRDHLTLASTEDAIARADIVLLLVNHRRFRNIDRRLLLEKVVIDTRGMWR
ncbi:MAG: UDP-N-acetyl-D-mannosamine dehydrogenase [Acidobacteriaceae bacterium]|nr:UDP-N-acetyl-D-mannosamine dehydrogenase [Acidobacteriaceae bacterium]MBV9502244.1 UDP-N-acetyl-D-mannosamine dehydrogenase [Acidobacteriaceae bacterium]